MTKIFINRISTTNRLRHLSDRSYQEISWKSPGTSTDWSTINEDAYYLVDQPFLRQSIEEGKLVFSEEVDPLFEEIFDLSNNFDSSFDTPDYIINHPIMQEIRDIAAFALQAVQTATSEGKDVLYDAVIDMPFIDGSFSQPHGTPYYGDCEERPDGTFHIFNTDANVGRFPPPIPFKYQPGDIVKCEWSVSDNVFKNTILKPVEKIGFEEVVF